MIKAQETKKDYVAVGKVGATYGVRGYLKIHSYTEFGPDILVYQPWYLTYASKKRELVKVEAGKPHGKLVIAKVFGFDTPESARQLTGALIEVQRSALPELADQYYWSDLIGLSVINLQAKPLGTVVYLIETGAHDVLVVKAEKEIAIPYLPDKVIKKIDLQAQQILVDWE